MPKKYGGGGADIWTLARISYELAKGDPACALAFNMHQVMVGILKGLMPEEQQEEWMTRIASEQLLMCGAFSEERAGFTGLADMTAVPVRWEFHGQRPQGVGDVVGGRRPRDVQLHGHRRGRLDPRGSHAADGARARVHLREGQSPASASSRTWDTHGMRATGTQTLAFDDAVIPASAEVGDMRMGLTAEFEWAAMLFGGVYWGLSEKAYEATRKILVEKSLGATAAASDVPLRQVGFVQHGLGEMKVKTRDLRAGCSR